MPAHVRLTSRVVWIVSQRQHWPLQGRMLAVIGHSSADPTSESPQRRLTQWRPPRRPVSEADVNRATSRLSTLRLAVHDPLLLRLETELSEGIIRICVCRSLCRPQRHLILPRRGG